MIVNRIKSLVKCLLAMGAKITLAPIRSFSMFTGTRMTTEPTFHNLCVKSISLHLFYSNNHILTHNRISDVIAGFDSAQPATTLENEYVIPNQKTGLASFLIEIPTQQGIQNLICMNYLVKQYHDNLGSAAVCVQIRIKFAVYLYKRVRSHSAATTPTKWAKIVLVFA